MQKKLLTAALNLIYPCYCLLCHVKTNRTELICNFCCDKLPWQNSCCIHCASPLTAAQQSLCGSCLINPPIFQRALVPLLYQDSMIQLITGFKFKRKLVFGRALAQLFMLHYQQNHNGDSALPQCLIPVPLHAKRLRHRGFNQALELALFLGKTLQIPVSKNACIRIKNTASQSSLQALARSLNVKNAFAIHEPQNYSHIALVDDVMTTGHTVSELARVWHNAGVKQIDIWCCARAG